MVYSVWTRGWGPDLWGSAPWGAPSSGWYGCDELQEDLYGQYLTSSEATDLRLGGHVITDLTGNPLPLIGAY